MFNIDGTRATQLSHTGGEVWIADGLKLTVFTGVEVAPNIYLHFLVFGPFLTQW